jgi:hypothetical protein
MITDKSTPWVKYPTLFANREQGGCGHGCGAGWFPLINEACAQFAEIERLIGVKCLVKQTKEKFGTLRLYTSTTASATMTDEQANLWFDIVQAIANHAENRSCHICEESGAWGQARPLLGWVKTLSDEEYAKRVMERYKMTVEEFEVSRKSEASNL